MNKAGGEDNVAPAIGPLVARLEPRAGARELGSKRRYPNGGCPVILRPQNRSEAQENP